MENAKDLMKGIRGKIEIMIIHQQISLTFRRPSFLIFPSYILSLLFTRPESVSSPSV